MTDAPPTRSAGRPILIIDDDPEVVSVMTEILGEEGYVTVGTHSGAEAVAAARRESPALVLLDFYLAGEDATEVVAELRAACGDLPIVLLSGARELSTAAERLQVAGTLPKPFDYDALIDCIERHRRR